MSTFSQVYKRYAFVGGGRSGKINIFFCTLFTFWPDFYYFDGDFWYSKMLMCTLFLRGGRLSQKVYGLYTHENVNIYGQPLIQMYYKMSIRITMQTNTKVLCRIKDNTRLVLVATLFRFTQNGPFQVDTNVVLYSLNIIVPLA